MVFLWYCQVASPEPNVSKNKPCVKQANLENAQIEGEKLSKESKILDVELEIMKMELAIRKEEALKAGVVFEMVDLDENVDPGPDDEAAEDQPESKRLKTSWNTWYTWSQPCGYVPSTGIQSVGNVQIRGGISIYLHKNYK